MDTTSLVKSLQVLTISIAGFYIACLILWRYVIGEDISSVNILVSPVFFIGLVLNSLSFVIQGYENGKIHNIRFIIIGISIPLIWILAFFMFQFK